MIVQNPPALPGSVYRRPSSVGAADIYGSYPTAVPTTVTDGTVGGSRIDSAIADVQGAAPSSGDFLTSPAAVLVVLVVALAVFSLVED